VPDVVAAFVLHLDVAITRALDSPLRHFGRRSIDPFAKRTNGVSRRQCRGADDGRSNDDACREDGNAKALEDRAHLDLSRVVLRAKYGGKATVALLGPLACQFPDLFDFKTMRHQNPPV
jgi:hypothetical protein